MHAGTGGRRGEWLESVSLKITCVRVNRALRELAVGTLKLASGADCALRPLLLGRQWQGKENRRRVGMEKNGASGYKADWWIVA